MERVDILAPPDFAKTGKVKTKDQAHADDDWHGIFHLWIIQDQPIPAIIYQQRHPNASLGPMKLDVTVGGHYRAGESRLDGLREVKEELGVDYNLKSLTFLGRKLFFGPNHPGQLHPTVVDVHFVKDNRRLDQFILHPDELHALCLCPLMYLLKLHTTQTPFDVPRFLTNGQRDILSVTSDSFIYNWDNYHFKIALLAQRYLRGEKNLIY